MHLWWIIKNDFEAKTSSTVITQFSNPSSITTSVTLTTHVITRSTIFTITFALLTTVISVPPFSTFYYKENYYTVVENNDFLAKHNWNDMIKKKTPKNPLLSKPLWLTFSDSVTINSFSYVKHKQYTPQVLKMHNWSTSKRSYF